MPNKTAATLLRTRLPHFKYSGHLRVIANLVVVCFGLVNCISLIKSKQHIKGYTIYCAPSSAVHATLLRPSAFQHCGWTTNFSIVCYVYDRYMIHKVERNEYSPYLMKRASTFVTISWSFLFSAAYLELLKTIWLN